MNTVELELADLHPALADPDLLAMNFLNEVAIRFPEAVSFAAGRPAEQFFDPADLHRWLDLYLAGTAGDEGRRALFQYGPTKGLIQAELARHLLVDEGIEARPGSIIVTVGCQEAIHLTLSALRSGEQDVVLAVAPTYVGFTGAAKALRMPVIDVPEGTDGIDLAAFAQAVAAARAAGKRPRACYVMPDFANPSGHSMDVPTRRRLLELAAELDILLLEDNPYGFFTTAGRRPTLKSLDTRGQVVYLGSLAKTVMPGARVGYAVADQRVAGGGLLADEMAKLKSMVTVNTAALSQAVVAGRLIECDYSLRRANEREIKGYQNNLDLLRAGLERRFGRGPLAGQVTWNTPGGGFFLVLDVPCRVDQALLERSARDYGVIWTPMSYFLRGGRADSQIRLSFSLLDEQEIETGLDRLERLLSDELPG